MNFQEKGMKIVKNKYFSFFIYFLAFINVLGYLSVGDMRSLIWVSLVALVMSVVTENITLILIVSLLLSPLSKIHIYVEGLDNMDSSKKDNIKKKISEKIDERVGGGSGIHENGSTEQPTNDETSEASSPDGDSTMLNSSATSSSSSTSSGDTDSAVVGATESLTNKSGKAGKSGKGFGNGRVDYASTLNESYKNLSDILGKDGIKGLTNDTAKLMNQQKQLFESMQSMTPLLNQAQEMMQNFDMNQINELVSNVTGGVKGLSSSATKA